LVTDTNLLHYIHIFSKSQEGKKFQRKKVVPLGRGTTLNSWYSERSQLFPECAEAVGEGATFVAKFLSVQMLLKSTKPTIKKQGIFIKKVFQTLSGHRDTKRTTQRQLIAA
jgi:hypothetical protein